MRNTIARDPFCLPSPSLLIWLPPPHALPLPHRSAGTTADSDRNLYIEARSVAVIRHCAPLPFPAMSAALASGDADAAAYPAALLQVLDNMTDVRVMQYTLTLVCDFLAGDVERRAAAFLRGNTGPALKTLMQMMGTSSSGARISSREANPYVLEHAARATATLLSVDPSDQAALAGMLAWVHTNVKLFGSAEPRQVKVTEVRQWRHRPRRPPSTRRPPPTHLHAHIHTHARVRTHTPLPPAAQVAAESLMILLRNPSLRELFCGAAGPAGGDTGVHRLVAMLAAPSTQLAYASLHGLWLLSLSKRFNGALQAAGAPVAALRALRPDAPQKVLRMGLALLVNLMKDPACGATVTLVVESGQARGVLEALAVADPPVADPELLEDARWLREAVAARGGGRFGAPLDNVARYEEELAKGSFHWTVLHTAAFWKENAKAFERDGCSLLKQLAALLTVRTPLPPPLDFPKWRSTHAPESLIAATHPPTHTHTCPPAERKHGQRNACGCAV